MYNTLRISSSIDSTIFFCLFALDPIKFHLIIIWLINNFYLRYIFRIVQHFLFLKNLIYWKQVAGSEWLDTDVLFTSYWIYYYKFTVSIHNPISLTLLYRSEKLMRWARYKTIFTHAYSSSCLETQKTFENTMIMDIDKKVYAFVLKNDVLLNRRGSPDDDFCYSLHIRYTILPKFTQS